MSSYVELVSWMAQRQKGQNTLSHKWRQFIHSVPLLGPWYRNAYFDGFRAGVSSALDIISRAERQDPPILDLQLEELRDELLQLEQADSTDASHGVGSDKVKQLMQAVRSVR
jgi:hypothetical protein